MKINQKRILLVSIFLCTYLLYGNTSEELQTCQAKLEKANKRILELLDMNIKRLEGGKDSGNANQELKSKDVEKQEYIKKIKILNVKAKYYDSLIDGRIPGITFRLKNTGDKTLNMVEVTVYFLDKSGNTIHEESYTPVIVNAGYGSTKPLKPNYIWRIERGKFYSAKSVPKEWKTGKVKVEVSDISFAN